MGQDNQSFWADIKKYEEQLANNPGSFCFAQLSSIYLKVGLLDDALHVARTGIERYPSFISGLRALAMACHAKGLKDECRKALESVVTALPDDTEAQKMLGRLCAEEGDETAAINAFTAVLDFNPDDVEVRVELDTLKRLSAPAVSPAETVDVMDNEFSAFDDEQEEDIEEILEVEEIIEVDDNDLLSEEEEIPPQPLVSLAPPSFEDAPLTHPAEMSFPSFQEDTLEPEFSFPAVQEDIFEPAQTESHKIDKPEETGQTADPLSTATMAELYVKQGFISKALEIYRVILTGDPGNMGIRSRVGELELLLVGPSPETGAAAVLTSDIEALSVQTLAPLSTVMPPAQGVADNPVEILENWLENIRRIRACH